MKLERGLVWGYDPGGKESLAAIVAVKWVDEKAYVMFAKNFQD